MDTCIDHPFSFLYDMCEVEMIIEDVIDIQLELRNLILFKKQPRKEKKGWMRQLPPV